jgi:hypothetical protein
MASSGMLRCVALVKTDVYEELTRTTQLNISEDAILHSHHRENFKSYNVRPYNTYQTGNMFICFLVNIHVTSLRKETVR